MNIWPSESGEYVEFSIHGREILKALDYVKHHPAPPSKVLGLPPSPRPTHATLPPGWHDAEVALVAGTTEPRDNVTAGGSSPADFMQGDAATATGGQNIQQEGLIAQGATLRAGESTQVTVKKLVSKGGQQSYHCALEDGTVVRTPVDGWTACTILVSGEPYPGYGYTGVKGTQYYTWTLEVKGKDVK